MPLCAQNALHGTLRTTAQGKLPWQVPSYLQDTLRVMQARARIRRTGPVRSPCSRPRHVLLACAAHLGPPLRKRFIRAAWRHSGHDCPQQSSVFIATDRFESRLRMQGAWSRNECRLASVGGRANRPPGGVPDVFRQTASFQRRRSPPPVRRASDEPPRCRALADGRDRHAAVDELSRLMSLAQRGYVAFRRRSHQLRFRPILMSCCPGHSRTRTASSRPSRNDGAMIGLSFDPAGGLKNHTDIAGTFWLDAASHELRQLTFRHIGLPNMMGDSAGESRVRFATFGTQEWFIPEWIIRAPDPSADAKRQSRDELSAGR